MTTPREALEPFAKIADGWDGIDYSPDFRVGVPFADLRRARDALREMEARETVALPRPGGIAQYRALAILRAAGRPMTTEEVRAAVGNGSAGHTMQTLKGLLRRGLVERHDWWPCTWTVATPPDTGWRERAPSVAEVEALPGAFWMVDDGDDHAWITTARVLPGGRVDFTVFHGARGRFLREPEDVKRSRPCTRDGEALAWPEVKP